MQTQASISSLNAAISRLSIKGKPTSPKRLQLGSAMGVSAGGELQLEDDEAAVGIMAERAQQFLPGLLRIAEEMRVLIFSYAGRLKHIHALALTCRKLRDSVIQLTYETLELDLTNHKDVAAVLGRGNIGLQYVKESTLGPLTLDLALPEHANDVLNILAEELGPHTLRTFTTVLPFENIPDSLAVLHERQRMLQSIYPGTQVISSAYNTSAGTEVFLSDCTEAHLLLNSRAVVVANRKILSKCQALRTLELKFDIRAY